MQLVAYGAQDIYLTGNPQITFFKVVYRRHTNFSMEAIQQTINGGPAASGSSTVTISRNGDLVYSVYVTCAPTLGSTEGSDLVQEVELEIGGQRIDKHYKEWIQIWNELSTPESKAIGLKAMKCDIGTSGGTGVGNIQIPLQFWFCRNPGLALPLIALQYHEVKLKFTWGGTTSPVNAQVWCDYIYLDTDERRRFAQVSHEYLIEQIQREALPDALGDHKLNFNHPVKELIWTSSTDYATAKLSLNGHDRFAAQEEEYFQLRQPYDYHTAVPRQNLPTAAQINSLDKTAVFATIDSDTAADLDFSGLGGTALDPIDTLANNGDITLLNGVITFQNAAPLIAIMDLSLGDVLAFVNTVGATTVGTGGNIGTYFATVIAVPAQTSATVVTFSVSTPTRELANGTTQSMVGPFAAGDNLVTNIYKVTNANAGSARTSKMTDKINVYSFGLKPEEHQPSGTCNFSRIDNSKLNFGAAQGAGNIYAVNYNVLRIMSGMGGLAYSN